MKAKLNSILKIKLFVIKFIGLKIEIKARVLAIIDSQGVFNFQHNKTYKYENISNNRKEAWEYNTTMMFKESIHQEYKFLSAVKNQRFLRSRRNPWQRVRTSFGGKRK